MIKIIELKASVTYKGTGSQTKFDFPFDYLRKSFVKVSVDNELIDNTEYTIDGRTVVFLNAPQNDSVIRIYRETTTNRLVVWADASVLKASDMTIAEVQQLHILEEGQDWSKTNSIVLDDNDIAWQGRNYRVSNLADPQNPQDAVTKNYLEHNFMDEKVTPSINSDVANAFAASKAIIKTSEDNAAASAAKAKTSEDNAAASAAKTKTSEDNAAASAAKAKTSEDNAAATLAVVVKSVNNQKPDDNGNVEVDTMPTGTILAFAGQDVPEGYLLCNGAAISRSTYARLFSAIGTLYGAGDGSTTFTLPNLIDRFLEGGDSSTAGNFREAGLPNITGSAPLYGHANDIDTT